MVGQHQTLLRKELRAEEALAPFADRVSALFRLLCTQNFVALERDASDMASLLWEKLLGGMSAVVCCKEAFLIAQLATSLASVALLQRKPRECDLASLDSHIQGVDRAQIMGAPAVITAALQQEFGKLPPSSWPTFLALSQRRLET